MKKKKLKPSDGIEVGEVGRIRCRGRCYVIGVSPLRKHGLRGIVFPPEKKTAGAILISTHLPVRGIMVTEVIIHETLHAAFPRASERKVVSAARLVAKVLSVYRKSLKQSLIEK